MFRVALITCFTAFRGFALTIYPMPQPLEAVVLPDAQGIAKPAAPDDPIILELSIAGMIDFELWDDVALVLVQAQNGSMRPYQIKAILIDLDSTLGAPSYSGVIFNSIRQFADRLNIPVYAYVSANCSGAGYLAACAADLIYCADSATIGGLGVLTRPFFNFRNNITIEEHFMNLQVAHNPEVELLYEGTYKNAGDPFAIWDDQLFENTAEQTEVLYNNFIDIIAARRPHLTKEQIRDQLGAREFSGLEAGQLGLVDAVSQTRASTLHDLSLAAGIAANYRVVALIKADN